MNKTRFCASVALIAASAYGFEASAQPASISAARAEQLFKQGRELVAAGRFDEACSQFAESQALDPAAGTLLNLADCYEKSGKLASAWFAYAALVPEAQRLGQKERESYANDRIAALEPRVSRLTLEFAAGVRSDDLRIELDGKPLAPAAVRAAFPVDGGGHRVRVTSAGHEPWIGHVALAREKDRKTLQVPALRPISTPAAVTPSASGPIPAPDAAEGGTSPAIYAFGAGTIVCAIGAGVTGGLALGKASEFDEANDDPSRTPDERQELRDQASNLALVSTILTGAAVAAGGVTVYLYLSRPSGTSEARTARAPLRVSPWVGAGAAGLGVSGSM